MLASACASGPAEYSGVYRQGFEHSHFFPDSGGGPWWVSWEGEVFGDRLEPFRIGDGRGRVALVRMTVTGELSRDGVPDFLGRFGNGLKVREIVALEQASEADYAAALKAARD